MALSDCADARIRRLVCVFVVCMQQSQVSSRRCPLIEKKRLSLKNIIKKLIYYKIHLYSLTYIHICNKFILNQHSCEQESHARTPESFVRGVPTLTTFFFYFYFYLCLFFSNSR